MWLGRKSVQNVARTPPLRHPFIIIDLIGANFTIYFNITLVSDPIGILIVHGTVITKLKRNNLRLRSLFEMEMPL